jgi:hypothetical protein
MTLQKMRHYIYIQKEANEERKKEKTHDVSLLSS